MLRKMLYAGLAASLLSFFVFGRDVVSYAKTFGSEVREAVKSEIDVEFEVERARRIVEELVPDIRECMTVIAEQKVDIRNLEQDIRLTEAAMGEQERAILVLREDLDSDRSTFRYANFAYSRDDVEQDLTRRFERFVAAKASLDADKQILSARNAKLRANRDTLNGMMSRKQELEVSLAQLEARLKTLQAAETISSLEFDDSNLARAKSLIEDLNRQLDIRESLLDAQGQFTNLIPIENASGSERDIAAEIDAWFGIGEEQDAAQLAENKPAA